MANTLAPFGFSHIGYGAGAAPNYGMVSMKIASGDSTACGHGDPVKDLNTGYVARWTASTAAARLAGVLIGCRYYSSTEGRIVYRNYWPGSGATGDVEAFVVPCQFSMPPLFLVQSSGTAITQADVGINADVSLGTVNTTTGMSGATLDQGTLATTATLPFRITGLFRGVGNGSDAASSYNWVIVTPNVTGLAGI